MTRLLLVEDHVLVRQSIRAYLEGASFDIVGEATTGTEAVDMSAELQPDVVVMDIHLPEMNGIEATRRIRKQCKNTRVIALTAYNEPAYVRALQQAGATGFVLKTAKLPELLRAIEEALTGHSMPHDKSASVEDQSASGLTEREIEVLKAASRGWTNKQIGGQLKISDRTVQVHMYSICRKLNSNSRTEAVSRAIAFGLISPHDGGDYERIPG